MGNYATRYALVSYLSQDKIEAILNSHDSDIDAAAYIQHEPDVGRSSVHWHVYLYLATSRESCDILKWFKDDSENTLINKNSFSKGNSLAYMLHANKDSIEAGKKLYNLMDVHFFKCDVSFFRVEREDKTFEILNAYLNGCPLRVLAQQYGRDFIYHYASFVALANEIKRQEAEVPKKSPDMGSYVDPETGEIYGA